MYLKNVVNKCKSVNLNDVASKKEVDSLQRKLDDGVSVHYHWCRTQLPPKKEQQSAS